MRKTIAKTSADLFYYPFVINVDKQQSISHFENNNCSSVVFESYPEEPFLKLWNDAIFVNVSPRCFIEML